MHHLRYLCLCHAWYMCTPKLKAVAKGKDSTLSQHAKHPLYVIGKQPWQFKLERILSFLISRSYNTKLLHQTKQLTARKGPISLASSLTRAPSDLAYNTTSSECPDQSYVGAINGEAPLKHTDSHTLQNSKGNQQRYLIFSLRTVGTTPN